jgi:hypothetical protein
MKTGGELPRGKARRLRRTAGENNSGRRSLIYDGIGIILASTWTKGYLVLSTTT